MIDMAQPFEHGPVKFFIGVIFNPSRCDKNKFITILEKHLRIQGGVCSETIVFDQFTNYYLDEMGKELRRFWTEVGGLKSPEELVPLKLGCAALEKYFANDNKRKVNLDPGYITEAKLILATFKDFSHRIYISDGVFADLQMMFRNGRYEPMPWTFADYRSDYAQSFFTQLREKYRAELKVYRDTQSGRFGGK